MCLRWILVVCLCLVTAACNREEFMSQLTERVFSVALKQYIAMDARLTDRTLPRTLDENGMFVNSDIRWWCSGFYPGSLWYIYEYTGDAEIRTLAEKNTRKLEPIQFRTDDHDVGFQLNCSYGNAFRLTADTTWLTVLRQGAQSLSTRFSCVTGTIRSWDFVRKGCDWRFPVIIDNLMNLELLMSVAREAGVDSLRQIACAHASTTLRNHFRSDYTCFHLVDYDPEDGHVRGRQTVQGLRDDSAWARGQAWALYGYTMMYRMADSVSYLVQAENIARMLLERLPEDGVPYWDFDAPGTLRDASAAAVMASAFVELSGYTTDQNLRREIVRMAERQLRTLASPIYLAEPGANGNFLLKHSVGALPDGKEVDVPLTYADYYFLEALMRFRNLESTI